MYRVNEVYRSVQGEGYRTGTENIFVRFSGCNMRCDLEPGPKSPGGFMCDTEFESGRDMSLIQLLHWIMQEDVGIDTFHFLMDQKLALDLYAQDHGHWVLLTGGEPALQIDGPLIRHLHNLGYKIAVETNGSIQLPEGIDWVTVSPKVAEHCIKQLTANEVKYVRGYGQALPKTRVKADHYYISPTFQGNVPDGRAVQWCQEIIKGTEWQLTLQSHKLQGIR